MKTFVFISLLSLSACLGEQTQSMGPKDQQPQIIPTVEPKQQVAVDPAQNVSSQSANKVPEQTASNVPEQTASNVPMQTASNVPGQTQKLPVTENTTMAEGTVKSTETAPIVPRPNETKTEEKDKLPEKKESEIKPVIEINEMPKNETKPIDGPMKHDNATMVDDKEKKMANVTSKPEMGKATEAPVLQARGFDGPSFIGGIVLTLSLIAISFIGYKYYKNQTERNYYGTL